MFVVGNPDPAWTLWLRESSGVVGGDGVLVAAVGGLGLIAALLAAAKAVAEHALAMCERTWRLPHQALGGVNAWAAPR